MKKRNKFADSVTPFIDVAFVLILFFSTSLVFAPEDYVKLELPENNSQMKTIVEIKKDLIFNVKNDGSAYINSKLFCSANLPDSVLYRRAFELTKKAKVLWIQKNNDLKDLFAIVRADSGVAWKRPIQIVQAVSKNGIRLSVALKPVDEE